MRILGVDALAAVTSRNNVRKTARLASLDVFRGLSIAVSVCVCSKDSSCG
jgi:predicted acyltransferase